MVPNLSEVIKGGISESESYEGFKLLLETELEWKSISYLFKLGTLAFDNASVSLFHSMWEVF